MLGPLDVNLKQFGVSTRFGFLPDQYPLQRLPNHYYSAWEAVIAQLPVLVKTRAIRRRVDQLRILSTSRLQSEREWQRAYVILSLLTHGYIWGGMVPSEVSHALHLTESRSNQG